MSSQQRFQKGTENFQIRIDTLNRVNKDRLFLSKMHNSFSPVGVP